MTEFPLITAHYQLLVKVFISYITLALGAIYVSFVLVYVDAFGLKTENRATAEDFAYRPAACLLSPKCWKDFYPNVRRERRWMFSQRANRKGSLHHNWSQNFQKWCSGGKMEIRVLERGRTFVSVVNYKTRTRFLSLLHRRSAHFYHGIWFTSSAHPFLMYSDWTLYSMCLPYRCCM